MSHTFHLNNYPRQLLALAAQGSLNTAYVAPFATSGGTGDADRAVFLLWVGATSGNIDFALYQASDSGGTGRKAVTGASITAITSSTDEGFVTVEIGPGALDDANGFKYVRGEVTVASGTPVYGVMLINHRLRYPGVGTAHSTYLQRVVVLG